MIQFTVRRMEDGYNSAAQMTDSFAQSPTTSSNDVVMWAATLFLLRMSGPDIRALFAGEGALFSVVP